MRLTRFKLAFLSYALFDLLIGGHCGGLLPLEQLAAAQTGAPAIGNITSSGTTCSLTSVPTNCVVLQLDGSTGAASIDISGTWAATLQIEAFGGVTWAALNCTPPNSTTAVSSTTANGVWQCNVAGFSSIRIRASAYSSGTAAVVINSAHASAKSGGGAVFASGGTTNNVIPKSNGSSALADSSITDDGTTVISTEPIRSSGGTSAAAVGIQVGAVNNGFWKNSNTLLITAVGTDRLAVDGSIFGLRSDARIIFSSNTNPDTTADTGLSRGNVGILDVGNGGATDTSGTVNMATLQYRGLAQTTFVTSDFTTSGVGTALEAITGLTWTFPATTAINARIDCNILYLQNVANVAVAFGFQDATVAPTNLAASGIQYTSATASTEGTLAASATTTATAVTSATPSAITTIWHAQLHFLIEQPSNASTSVFTIRTSTATAGDTVTVKRGSYCALAQ